MGNIGEAQTSKSHLLVRPIYKNGPQWQNIGEARASKLQWIDAPALCITRICKLCFIIHTGVPNLQNGRLSILHVLHVDFTGVFKGFLIYFLAFTISNSNYSAGNKITKSKYTGFKAGLPNLADQAELKYRLLWGLEDNWDDSFSMLYYFNYWIQRYLLA